MARFSGLLSKKSFHASWVGNGSFIVKILTNQYFVPLVTFGGSMQVGDLIKHKNGTMQGSGVVLAISPPDRMTNHERADALWTSHGFTRRVTVTTMFMEVVGASR